MWPRWLPVRLRMPLIAQVTGAVALTALIVGPWWAKVPDQVPPPQSPASSAPEGTTVAEAPAAPTTPPLSAPASEVPAAVRPAHLNLDVRHSFKTVDFSVSVDGKPVVDTQLEGSGKRFKVFGKRTERGYTKTLQLDPGVRLVKVHVRSLPDKFDQTRIERFDLGSASVASLQIWADKSGLGLVAERPPAPPPVSAEAVTSRPAPAAAVPAPAPEQPPAPASPAQPATAAVVEFLHTLRSMLMWIAGFVATTATAFVFEEWLRKRKEMLFRSGEALPGSRRRRRIQGAIDAP